MLIRFRVLLLALGIFVIVGCPKQPGQDEFVEIERLPENQRLARFSAYPVELQIDMFLFAQINLAGKGVTYLRYLADDGQAKKRQIAARIDSTERSSFKADLIVVLDEIDLSCSCVHNDSGLMDLLVKNDLDILDTDPPDVRLSKELYKKILDRLKLRMVGTGLSLRL